MKKSRKLGRLEQTMELLNSRAKTWNIITISRIKGNLQEQTLQKSLDILRYHHPQLNYCIVHDKNGFYFQNTTYQISVQVVEKSTVEEWQDVVNLEMNQAIESDKILMRVVLVHILNEENISYLITTLHHAIADGLSSIKLHSEILNHCQKIMSGEIIQADPPLTTLPPVEELLPNWTKAFRGKIVNLTFLLKLALQELINPPKTLGFERYAAIPQRDCYIIHKQINPEIMQNFIQKCRQEKTTVHSALCVAGMFTIAREIMNHNQKSVKISCLSHVDLRQRLTPHISEENLAALATSMLDFYTLKTHTSFWNLARKVKQNIDINIQSNDIFKMVLIAKLLIKFCLFFPQKVAATVSLSNVGKVNIPTNYGDLKLEEISFAGSSSFYAGMFIMHAATFQEKMLLNFVFSHPSISQKTMELLVNNFLDCISNISSSSVDFVLI